MNLEYIEINGYKYPKLRLENYKKVSRNFGKYGNLSYDYLKNHNKNVFDFLLESNNLEEYLQNIQIKSIKKLDDLIKEMKINRDINEKLKEDNFLKWTGEMNNIKNCAEEIVISTIIYSKI